MEHVTCGKNGLTVLVDVDVLAKDIPIATNNLLGFGIPHDKLLVAVVHSVEFIKVESLARSTSGFTEYDLPKSSNLIKGVGRIVSVDNINLVMTAVGHSELSLGG